MKDMRNMDAISLTLRADLCCGGWAARYMLVSAVFTGTGYEEHKAPMKEAEQYCV